MASVAGRRVHTSCEMVGPIVPGQSPGWTMGGAHVIRYAHHQGRNCVADVPPPRARTRAGRRARPGRLRHPCPGHPPPSPSSCARRSPPTDGCLLLPRTRMGRTCIRRVSSCARAVIPRIGWSPVLCCPSAAWRSGGAVTAWPDRSGDRARRGAPTVRLHVWAGGRAQPGLRRPAPLPTDAASRPVADPLVRQRRAQPRSRNA